MLAHFSINTYSIINVPYFEYQPTNNVALSQQNDDVYIHFLQTVNRKINTTDNYVSIF